MAEDPSSEAAWAQLFLLPRLLLAVPPATAADNEDRSSVSSVLGKRLRQAWAGDWLNLWAATARPVCGSGRAKPGHGSAADKAQVRRVHELVVLGELSRAAAAARGPGKLATGPLVANRLLDLFPAAASGQQPQAPAEAVQDPAPGWVAQAAARAVQFLRKFPRRTWALRRSV